MSKSRKEIVLETLNTLANFFGADEPATMCDTFGITDDEAFDVDADRIQEAILEYPHLRELYDAQTKSLELQTEATERLQSSLDAEKSAHAKACELLAKGADEIDRLRVELKSAISERDRAERFLSNAEKACAEWQDRAGRIEAQRNTAIRDTAAALRVVRLLSKDGQEAKQ